MKRHARTASRKIKNGDLSGLARSGFDYSKRRMHRYLVTPRRVEKLSDSDAHSERQLAQAFRRTFDSPLSDDRYWFDQIESTRAQYNSGFNGEDIADAPKSPPEYAQLLYHLIRQFEPNRGIEFGTSVGISALYQAAAMERNGHGELTTMEMLADFSRAARKSASKLGLDHRITFKQGNFDELLPQLLKSNTIDFAFIDGNHDGEATRSYYSQLRPALDDSAFLIFDDINWDRGMEAAWADIRRTDQVAVSATLGKMGICILDTDVEGQTHHTLLM